MENFATMLAYLRKTKGLSQERLAKDLGISRSALAGYEQGRRQPNFEIEETIADYFNIDLNTLRGLPAPELDKEEVKIINDYKQLSSINKKAFKRYLAYLLSINNEDIETIKEALENVDKI